MNPNHKGAVAALLLAISLGVAAFWSARALNPRQAHTQHHSEPATEIEWMRTEFKLTPDEFRKVEQLHTNYVPRCDEYCAKIAESTRKLNRIARQTNGMSDALAKAIRQDEETRADCREALLTHLYETAGAMPADKGRRFLKIALPKVLSPNHSNVHTAISH